ncbi:hypothetical protein Tco_0790657 [Tanacetum coccineum]
MQHLVMGRNAIPKSQTLGTVAHTGEKFKKAQDAKQQVLKREHSQKAKRAMELRKKRKEFRIQSALPAPEQALSESSRRKSKHMELEPEIKGLGRNFGFSKGDLDIVDDEGIFVGDLMYEFKLWGVEGDDGEGSLGLGIMAFLSELVILLDS